MFKWVEVGTINNVPRYEHLSAFLTENGFPNKVEFEICKPEDLATRLPTLLEQYDGIRIGRGLGEIVVPMFPDNNVLVSQLRAADAIIRLNGKWQLKANAAQGLSQALVRVGTHFDFESSVLVVGTGAASKIAVRSLFQSGFKNFVVSAMDIAKVEAMVAELKRTHLNANFKIIPKEGLILLPGTHGVLVNTTPMTVDNPILAELNYFNFFKQGGVAIDFTISPVDSPVLLGAKEIGAVCVHGFEISGFTDLIWASQITGRKLEEGNYVERLGSKLRNHDSKS